jgi:hypothetical protein
MGWPPVEAEGKLIHLLHLQRQCEDIMRNGNWLICAGMPLSWLAICRGLCCEQA